MISPAHRARNNKVRCSRVNSLRQNERGEDGERGRLGETRIVALEVAASSGGAGTRGRRKMATNSRMPSGRKRLQGKSHTTRSARRRKAHRPNEDRQVSLRRLAGSSKTPS